MKHLIDFRLIFCMILIIAFMWVTNLENELIHDHFTETYGYPGWFNTYTITYCKTERAQILSGKEHKETLESIRYFNDH